MYEFLLKKRRIIFLLVVMGSLAGFLSLLNLPIKLYPNIAKPVISIRFWHPSYTAIDFADAYGETISTAIKTVEGVERNETSIYNGRTIIRLDFDYGLSAEEMKKKVITAIDAIIDELPTECEDYYCGYWQGQANEMDIALFSNEIDERTLYETAKPIIIDYLSKLPDVENVAILNVEELRCEIILDQAAVFSYGLSPDGIVNAIKTGYKDSSVGSLRTVAGTYSLRVKKDINTLFDIGKIIVGYSGARTIQLKDIATININYGLPRTAYRVNGNRSIMIYIEPKIDGNLTRLSKDVHKALEKIVQELPEGVQYKTVLDPATFIMRSVNNVVQSAIVGALLAVFCIILLIGEAKNSFIIAASIPLSVILGFILMNVFGVTINLISLSGLALAVGMIVDAAIVVMENIYRHREEELHANDGIIKNFITLIGSAVKEVAFSIVGSVLTSICVFLPLSFTSPLTSSILGDLANTVVFTLVSSLLVALFVVPLAAYYVFRTKNKIAIEKQTIFIRLSNHIVQKLFTSYEKILQPLLIKKRASFMFIALSVVALLLCFTFLFPRITKEIIAAPQSNILSISFSNTEVQDQEELAQAIQPLEQDLLENFSSIVKLVFSMVGRNGNGTMIVTLDRASSLPKMIDLLQEKYPSTEPWTYTFSSYDPSAMPLPTTYALHLRVEGPERKQIFAIQDEIVDLIKNTNLYSGVRVMPNTSLSSEIALYPRNEVFTAIPEYTVNRLTSMIRYVLNGVDVIKMTIEDTELTFKLQYPLDTLKSVKDIQDFQIPYAEKTIPIKHFFDFYETSGINQLYYVDGKETYNIYTTLRLSDPQWKQTDYAEQIRQLISEKITVPNGYRLIYEDTQKVINESISSLIVALLLSIVLIYVILGIQFNSLRIPLVILVTIPFAFIGVILSLFVFKSTISLNSMLGVILLGGIVVNNAIIIIDFYLSARKDFENRLDAILYAVKLRFRPILITTITTILGMLPIAFALGDGANIIQPLGIAVSGGLAFSSFFTLFMIPVILNFFEITHQNHDDQ